MNISANLIKDTAELIFTKKRLYSEWFLENCNHRRTLLENEKEHNLEEAEYFFNRGDSKTIDNFSKVQTNKRDSAWQIRWLSNTQISTRTTRCTCRKRRSRRFRTSKKGNLSNAIVFNNKFGHLILRCIFVRKIFVFEKTPVIARMHLTVNM